MKEKKKRRKLIWISVIVVVLLAFGGLVLKMGGRMGDVYADAQLMADGRTKINACVVSSIGYVRTMEMRVEGEDVYLDFYRTFGINQPLGARNEYIVNIPRDVQRIYVWLYGEYRVLHERSADGGWERVQ